MSPTRIKFLRTIKAHESRFWSSDNVEHQAFAEAFGTETTNIPVNSLDLINWSKIITPSDWLRLGAKEIEPNLPKNTEITANFWRYGRTKPGFRRKQTSASPWSDALFESDNLRIYRDWGMFTAERNPSRHNDMNGKSKFLSHLT